MGETTTQSVRKSIDIFYADGGEELYRHSDDPGEFKNLAGQVNMTQVKERLARWLPKENVPEAPRDKNLTKKQPRKKSAGKKSAGEKQ